MPLDEDAHRLPDHAMAVDRLLEVRLLVRGALTVDDPVHGKAERLCQRSAAIISSVLMRRGVGKWTQARTAYVLACGTKRMPGR